MLSCPAIYLERAYFQPFGSRFRRKISVPFGFLDSLSIQFLREFEGEWMLIMGQYDGLNSAEAGGIEGQSAGLVSVADEKGGMRTVNSAIPFEVVDAIEKSLTPDRFRKIVLPECDHAVSAWLRANPAQARNLACEIVRFLNPRIDLGSA